MGPISARRSTRRATTPRSRSARRSTGCSSSRSLGGGGGRSRRKSCVHARLGKGASMASRIIGILLAGLIEVACSSNSSSVTGSTTTNGDGGVVLESQRLVPSATGRFCELQGTLHNTGRHIDSLRIDFRAFNAVGVEIATATVIEFSIAADGRVAY